MDYLVIDALVNGIIYSHVSVKQNLGRRFATHLGLIPGKSGRDGGIDGYATIDNEKIYFQSKLFQNKLDASYVADFVGNLVIHEADIGIMLAGVGYTDGFYERLQEACKSKKLNAKIKVDLLTLEDIFGETEKFELATQDLPPLRDLSNGEWAKYK